MNKEFVWKQFAAHMDSNASYITDIYDFLSGLI